MGRGTIDMLNLLSRYIFDGQTAGKCSWVYSKLEQYNVKEGYKQVMKEKRSYSEQMEDWALCVWNR